MLNRREVLTIGLAGFLGGTLSRVLAATNAKRLLLVHGRGQEGQNPTALKSLWVEALKKGATAAGLSIPADVQISLPFYGDTLDRFTRESNIPLTSDVTARGGALEDEFLVFQAAVAEAVRQRAGVTEDDVDREYGENRRPRGPLNWEWVQATLRAVDKHGGGMGARAIELLTRDVFLYSTRAGVRDEIDSLVSRELTVDPTVVVGHSLGTLVTYSVMVRDTRRLQIPLLITVGSPLGIRAVRDQFRPLRYPPVDAWYNAFDPRDVVALYPLDGENFPVQPAIENNGTVRNHTDNRHGIVGYLDDANVAMRIINRLS